MFGVITDAVLIPVWIQSISFAWHNISSREAARLVLPEVTNIQEFTKFCNDCRTSLTEPKSSQQTLEEFI